MLDFSTRAYLSEWMDEPCSFQDFRACLLDLAQVNRMTFAYHPTLQWLTDAVAGATAPVHIVDVGCGGGDMLRRIEGWAARKKIAVVLTGIDLNPYAAPAARERTSADSQIRWVTGDAFGFQPEQPIDVVISSLFTHHLPDGEIERFVRWMEQHARRGWFINDLHRERLPYHGFQLLAALMRWHRFVRHDGPISIRRAFRHADWRLFLRSAGVPADAARIVTFRPARLCVARLKP